MSSDFGTWVSFIAKFAYDFLYTVNVPGLNIPFVYFFIIISTLSILISILKRTLFSPSRISKLNSKPNKNND